MNNPTNKHNDNKERARFKQNDGPDKKEKQPFEILSDQFKVFGKALKKVLKSD